MKKLLFLFVLTAQFIQAQNLILTEQFASCSLPGNWSLLSESGPYGFKIIKSNLMPQSDATCSIVYSQSVKNDKSQRKFSITTKEFTLYSFESYSLSYGLRFVKSNPNSSLKLFSIIDGTKTLIHSFSNDVLQNPFVLVTQYATIPSLITNKKLQFVFEYFSDGDDNNTLILIDNITLNGPDNDDCLRAVSIKTDGPCLGGNTIGAFLTGPKILCPGTYTQGLWYVYKSDYTGNLKINTRANYNDAISIFEGSCPSLKDLTCFNTDEYGFTGERNFIKVENGKNYYFRVARQTGYYGRDDLNDLCISITKEEPKYPIHDLCNNSTNLQINSPCIKSNNIKAEFSNPIPSLNDKSRADIWYNFKPVTNQDLIISTNADFADVITIYKGSCNQLEEIKCEDLGGKLILNSPITGATYFIQISGYFSTIEGNICAEVKTKSSDKPTNEDCPTAKAITLNSNCQLVSTINSIKSTIKPSCVVYNAPDVWFSFIAPSEKNVAIHVESGFLYNWAVYSGTCSNLQEFACGKNPDPCNGYITLNGLTAGKQYFLQILSAVNPLKASEGQLCVKIEELSKAIPFSKLNLQLQVECLHGVLGTINYQATGGIGKYTYYGPSPADIFYPGTYAEAFIEDESGCRDFERILISCTPPSKCNNSTLDLNIQTECLKDSLGRQTGEVILHVAGKGGSGAYYYYGTQDGTRLKDGESYKIILIDTDSCYVIEEGFINCPPFDCSQSNLSVTANYICIDTLLKALLQVDVSGNLGKYTLSGNSHGEFMDHGSHYQIQVTDESGCSNMTSGEIICKFDSCAYARPELIVSYDCLLDSAGQITGKAILKIEANSKAGGIVIKGPQQGDTLHHLEPISIIMLDAFGCEIAYNGTVFCNVVNSNNQRAGLHATYYPNPTNQLLNISIPENTSKEILLSLYNSSGSILNKNYYSPQSNYKIIQLDTEKLKAGIYFIKLEGNDFYDIIRFIKI